MAYSLVGSVGVVSTGSVGAALSPSWGTNENRTYGNLLIMWVTTIGTGALPVTPADWSLAVQVINNSTTNTSSIYYKNALGSDTAPTIAGVSLNTLVAQLAEFTGGASVSPLDRTATGTGTTTPTVVSPTASDAHSGELLIAILSAHYTSAATKVTSHTFNNGANSNSSNNDGTSIADHYNYTYGVTTSSNVADSDSVAFTATNISGIAACLASFQLSSPYRINNYQFVKAGDGISVSEKIR